MIYSLENSNLKITASPYGAELHSITGKKDNTEFLWNGNAEYWKYHAPVLFPIVGKVINSKYRVDGNEYELPQHGLARISDFNLISQCDNSLEFELKYNEGSLKVYPYKFSLKISYTLLDSGVKVGYTVTNLDNKNIYFSIGAHPAFMCPIEEDEVLEDCFFEFNKKETSSIMLLNESGNFSRERASYLNDENRIPLCKDAFKNDALVFDDLKSDAISIKSNKSNKSLTLEFNNFPYMGLWAPINGAPFVCIEPWFGHADFADFNGDFKDKEGVINLDIDKSFSCSFNIIISE